VTREEVFRKIGEVGLPEDTDVTLKALLALGANPSDVLQISEGFKTVLKGWQVARGEADSLSREVEILRRRLADLEKHRVSHVA